MLFSLEFNIQFACILFLIEHVSLINDNYSDKPAFIFVMKPVFFCMSHTFYLGIVMASTISTWEGVGSDRCLAPTHQLVNYISWREIR